MVKNQNCSACDMGSENARGGAAYLKARCFSKAGEHARGSQKKKRTENFPLMSAFTDGFSTHRTVQMMAISGDIIDSIQRLRWDVGDTRAHPRDRHVIISNCPTSAVSDPLEF